MRNPAVLPPALSSSPFTTYDALQAGVSRHRLEGSDLTHPFRGVHVVGDGAALIDLCRGLQRRVGEDAFFCSSTAALLMGAPLPARLERVSTVHVGVRAPATAPIGRGIRGHSISIGRQELIMHDGIVQTNAARTWCDLGSVLPLADLVAVGDYLIHRERRLTDVQQLTTAVMRYGSRRGIRLLRAAIPLLSDRSDSRQESRLRLILVAAGLGEVAANVPITTTDGFRYRADFAFVGRRVLVEYQSGYHETSEQYRADQTRRSRLEADGWFVVEVNADDLADSRELVRRLARVLALRPIVEL